MRFICGFILSFAVLCGVANLASAQDYRVVEARLDLVYDGDGRTSDFAACQTRIPIRVYSRGEGDDHGASLYTCYGSVENMTFKVSISVGHGTTPRSTPPSPAGKYFNTTAKIELWENGDLNMPFVFDANSAIVPVDFKGTLTHPLYLDFEESPKLPGFHYFQVAVSYLDI